VKKIIEGRDDVLYLDLERSFDLQKLDDPEWFLESQSEKLIRPEVLLKRLKETTADKELVERAASWVKRTQADLQSGRE
jgi:hypothetical protein